MNSLNIADLAIVPCSFYSVVVLSVLLSFLGGSREFLEAVTVTALRVVAKRGKTGKSTILASYQPTFGFMCCNRFALLLPALPPPPSIPPSPPPPLIPGLSPSLPIYLCPQAVTKRVVCVGARRACRAGGQAWKIATSPVSTSEAWAPKHAPKHHRQQRSCCFSTNTTSRKKGEGVVGVGVGGSMSLLP